MMDWQEDGGDLNDWEERHGWLARLKAASVALESVFGRPKPAEPPVEYLLLITSQNPGAIH